MGVIKATAKAMMAAGRGVQCQQNGEGLISTRVVCKKLKGAGTALAKEYIERRLIEPVKFLLLPKMGLLGSIASTKKCQL